MAKRKRNDPPKEETTTHIPAKTVKSTATPSQTPDAALHVQVITGSYGRVLHGFTAGLPASSLHLEHGSLKAPASSIQCIDTFLFEAHGSAIRCLALSPMPKPTDPSEAQKVILASGSTDERINLYSLSAAPAAVNDDYPSVPTLAGNKILENPKNRELGSLLHHTSSISALAFPSRSKLLASGEDNIISVSKTRDLSLVSTIKAPHPKVYGRPSGDTAPEGAAPSGVNHFAVHPSMKLMLSVGKGEKCMRLWNLVTGKKAGVLNFDRELLTSVNETKWSSGEGRRIAWNAAGEEFAVAFEWGAVVFGIDSTPKCRLVPSPRSKIHQMKYISVSGEGDEKSDMLAISTEDGRLIFYSTNKLQELEEDANSTIPHATPVAQVGGKQAGFPGRVKDFEILSLENQSKGLSDGFLLVTGNSEGVVRIWRITNKDLALVSARKDTRQVGSIVTSYETGNRITCLASFIMLPEEDPETLLDTDDEEDDDDDDSDDSNDSDE